MSLSTVTTATKKFLAAPEGRPAATIPRCFATRFGPHLNRGSAPAARVKVRLRLSTLTQATLRVEYAGRFQRNASSLWYTCVINSMTKEHPAARRPSPFRSERADNPTDRTRALLDRLDAQVGAIQDSDSFRAYLDVQARFHSYSFGNTLLILGQRPGATRVAGYRAWQALGRQVKRGEQAIRIFVPMTKKVENLETGEEERRTFFGVGSVFDIAQTEGEPLPQVEVPVLAGDDGGQLYDRLATVAEADGVTVERARDFGAGMSGTMGFYRPGEHPAIVVREAAPLQMTKTLAHELAHHLTGKHETYGELRAEHEMIAEASAYVVLAHFGFDSGARSFPYIAVWAKERTALREVLGTIQGVANTLISRVEAQGHREIS